MRTFLLLLLASVCLSFSAGAQNLVPDPSFEDYDNCPGSFGQIMWNPGPPPYPKTLKDWYSVLWNSPDYYNSCTGNIYASVPQNFHGYQVPRTGNAYIGLAYSAGPDRDFTAQASYHEFVKCRLTSPMVAGVTYDVYYYVNLIQHPDMCNSRNQVAFREMGAYFSVAEVNGGPAGNNLLLPYVSLKAAGNVYLDDSVNWMKVHNTYTATGGEEWMIIGAFHNTPTPPDMKSMCTGTLPNAWYGVYYLIDDVGVLARNECDTTSAVHDTVYCAETTQEITLQASRNGDSHHWNTGAATASITAGAGSYWCETVSGCDLHIDTFRVRKKASVSLELGADKRLCDGLEVTLGRSQAGVTYLWNTGSTECCINPQTSGIYNLEITDGCTTATDSVKVDFIRCKDCVLMPSAFSPNADGVNDRFGPLVNCAVSNYVLQVFNRWGERVFVSYRPDERWDGWYRGERSPLGSYFYVVEYRSPASDKMERLKGDVALVR